MKRTEKINIGIIGCGHWGVNYIRCFSNIINSNIIACCDIREENLNKIKKLHPFVKVSKDYKDILEDNSINAVVVATPANTHYRIVKDCLTHEKDILAEKPLTLDPEESLELVSLAERQKKILMVSHTFLYNAGIIKMKEYIKKGVLGRIYYINATRTHLGLIRNDVNAIWDLAPHDVSIFNYLTDTVPASVSAIGACHLKKGREDVAFINLIYPRDIIANIHVSWTDSNKERTIRVVGSTARAVFNDLDNLERVKIYKKGIEISEEYDDFGGFQLRLRDGDIISPKIELKEPLKEECLHFVECVRKRGRPITDGRNGFEVVKVMSAIERSLRSNGATEYLGNNT